MAQMPEIKPVVNKEPDKKPGLLSGLFGGGGGGSGASGLAGMGTSAAGGGGLLATKTGLLALVLAGTTVAGGIGVVGYKVFGPGESDQAGQNIQLFAAKPKAADADASATGAGASKDGNSASLSNLARANSGALGNSSSSAGASGATKDETSASASAPTTAGSAVNTAMSVAGGNGASTSMLKNTKKLGALSTSFGGGAGSAPSAGGSSKAGDSPALVSAAKGGQLGAMNNLHNGAVAGGRAVAARAGRRGAQGQARFARDMGRQNTYSMRGAGQGFENSAATNGGADGIGATNAISMGGVGDGTGAQPTSIPANQPTSTSDVPNVTQTPTYDATPYKKEMQIAQLLLLVAAGLLYYISTLAKTAKGDITGSTLALALTLCKVVMALGAAVGVIGGVIMGGKYNQQTQGLILIAAGAGVALAAWKAMSGVEEAATGKGADGTVNKPSGEDGAYTNEESGKGLAKMKDNTGSGTFILLGGGAALLGLVGNMLAPPKTCKSTVADDASKCTSMIQRVPGSPSQKALERYLS